MTDGRVHKNILIWKILSFFFYNSTQKYSYNNVTYKGECCKVVGPTHFVKC